MLLSGRVAFPRYINCRCHLVFREGFVLKGIAE